MSIQDKIETIKNQIIDLQNRIDNFEVSDHINESDYDDYIDEINGDVEILGMSYSASRVLQEIDPIAYRCGLSDYADTLDPSDFDEYNDMLEELEELELELEELELELEDDDE